MMPTIETLIDYDQTLAHIEIHLAKDSANLTEMDLRELQRLSGMIEQYEDKHYPMPIKTA